LVVAKQRRSYSEEVEKLALLETFDPAASLSDDKATQGVCDFKGLWGSELQFDVHVTGTFSSSTNGIDTLGSRVESFRSEDLFRISV
jgi:hypothetical protein